MLNFALNVSLTLRALPWAERFDTALRLGFSAIEFWWPEETDLTAIARHIRDAGLKAVLFNFAAGAIARGDRGWLNHPERQHDFRAHVPIALDFAHQIGCSRINALVGKLIPGESRQSQLARARDNLAWACEQAATAGIEIVVESLNAWENSGYLLTNTPDTLAFLGDVGAANLRYQYDCYHMQLMEGNITRTIRNHIDQIGHIQVADAPDRHQPGAGELHFPFIFKAIATSGYTGFIGLEFVPQGDIEAALAWLPPDRRGPIDPAALRWIRESSSG
ncbi:hydroxypyruvate isomerase family protein [Chloroflexus sp.]|uniref:hydroxypyruvate isomerase family protein n=1 Tax=Chloroflexus sp. TaxID=1904827 RepID=UPI00260C9661|nr:TIM barrel protein [uncultured Chloroflexus sp.]